MAEEREIDSDNKKKDKVSHKESKNMRRIWKHKTIKITITIL